MLPRGLDAVPVFDSFLGHVFEGVIPPTLGECCPYRRTGSMKSNRTAQILIVVGVFNVSWCAGDIGTAFTYQGELRERGVPVNATCKFEFSLWNSVSDGSQRGPTLPLQVNVVDGRFTVPLDFGAGVFQGSRRFLQMAVCCTASCEVDDDDILMPRQELTPAPYALSLRSLRIIWNSGLNVPDSPNVAGGHPNNTIAPNVGGATISGGGDVTGNHVNGNFSTIGGGNNNTVESGNSTIGGGTGNTAEGGQSTVAGGQANKARGECSFIGGGFNNKIFAKFGTVSGGGKGATIGNLVFDDQGTIGGGGENTAGECADYDDDERECDDVDTTGQTYATVGGGQANHARGQHSTIGGGSGNTAGGSDSVVTGGRENEASGAQATVGGGQKNMATATQSTVGGGFENDAIGPLATVGGGNDNDATGNNSTIGGGTGNRASGNESTVSGGQGNDAMGVASFVGGGKDNEAAGEYATTVGGFQIEATGDYSFAAGRKAKADNDGMFVWADSHDREFPRSPDSNITPAARQFLARATGGVVFVSNIDNTGSSTEGVELIAGTDEWVSLTGSSAKANIKPTNYSQILDKLDGVAITTWNYKSQDESIRHIGPMAEDFNESLGVGHGHRLSTNDMVGVALAAIQGLHTQLRLKNTEIETLESRVAALESALAEPMQNREGGAE